jgi:Gelsolin repeat
VDEATWAQFHTKDCYVIMWVADKEEQLVIHLHHWIGKEATADKWGAAAIRAVELNIFLGGMCRIHREEEGAESSEFKSYFADDLEYLFGGSDTGFRRVEEIKYAPKLYQVMRLGLGQCFYARRVEIHPRVLTKSDAFILDLGEYVLQWNGELVDVVHRQYALQLVNEIHLIEHQGKSTRFMLEERDTEAELGYQEDLFWKTLGQRVYLDPEELELSFSLAGEGAAAHASSVLLHGSWAQDDAHWQQGVPLIQDRHTKRWHAKLTLHFGHYTYRYEVLAHSSPASASSSSASSSTFAVDDERAVRVDKAGQHRNYIRVSIKEDPEPLLYHVWQLCVLSLSVFSVCVCVCVCVCVFSLSVCILSVCVLCVFCVLCVCVFSLSLYVSYILLHCARSCCAVYLRGSAHTSMYTLIPTLPGHYTCTRTRRPPRRTASSHWCRWTIR